MYSMQIEKHSASPKRIIAAGIIALGLMAASFYGGLRYSAAANSGRITEEQALAGSVLGKYEEQERAAGTDIDFQLFWEVWDSLRDNYVNGDELKEKELFYGALRGLAGATEDPYTVFMNPVVTQEFQDDLSGTFEGIGAEIGIKEGVLTIIAPLTDMPAQQAGLKPGDKILEINGEDTAGMSVDQAVSKIRGEKGTQVTLHIWREGWEEPRDITITRDQIVVKSVKWEIRDDGLAVIELSHFNNDTSELFDRAVREVQSAKPKGIILDLRSNPGGYLDTAVEVASEWVEDGKIVSERYGDDRVNDLLPRGRARLAGYPTVVLVNGGSASASEIVAGALKDHGKATIIGEQTFGKGSVQELVSFGDGSSLKVTVAEWLTPEGVNINEEGIVPDTVVEMTAEDYDADRDPQLDRAVELLFQ